MATQDRCCTIVPYFKVQSGQLGAFKEMCEQFVKSPELSALNFEVGYDRTTFVLGCHSFLLWVLNFILVDISTFYGDKMAGALPAVVA